MAGLFYEAEPEALRRTVERCLTPDASSGAASLPAASWRALLLPHAGHVYSGRIAGLGAGAVEWPSKAILLGPNHRCAGAPAALSGADAWRTPLGELPVDRALRDRLPALSRRITVDDRAHAKEHSLEVLLPFLQARRPDLRAVLLSIGEADLGLCLEVGAAIAAAVREAEARGERVAIVVSSDLNHYLPREANRLRDDRAIDALLLGDPEELFTRVLERERISMCGVLPATALLSALRSLAATRPVLLAQGDSSEAFGDESRVVGYASLVWREEGGVSA